MLLQFTPQLPWPPGWYMPWEEHAWQKAISLPRLIPVHSSCLYPIWFPSAQTAPLSPVPALWHRIPKGSTPQKVCFSLYFLIFTATVTSSPHTICSSSLPCWAVSGLWNVTAEVTSPPGPQLCLSRSQGLQLAHTALLRNTPANKGKSTSSLHP